MKLSLVEKLAERSMLAHSDEDDAKPSRSFTSAIIPIVGFTACPKELLLIAASSCVIIGTNPKMGVTTADAEESVPGLAIQLGLDQRQSVTLRTRVTATKRHGTELPPVKNCGEIFGFPICVSWAHTALEQLSLCKAAERLVPVMEFGTVLSQSVGFGMGRTAFIPKMLNHLVPFLVPEVQYSGPALWSFFPQWKVFELVTRLWRIAHCPLGAFRWNHDNE